MQGFRHLFFSFFFRLNVLMKAWQKCHVFFSQHKRWRLFDTGRNRVVRTRLSRSDLSREKTLRIVCPPSPRRFSIFSMASSTKSKPPVHKRSEARRADHRHPPPPTYVLYSPHLRVSNRRENLMTVFGTDSEPVRASYDPTGKFGGPTVE